MERDKLDEATKLLVEREVYCNQSGLVEAMLQHSLINYEDITNATRIEAEMPDGHSAPASLEDALEEADENIDALEGEMSRVAEAISVLEHAIADFPGDEETEQWELDLEASREYYDNMDGKLSEWAQFKEDLERGTYEEYQEIMEWWVVSGWLAEKLKHLGDAAVLESDYETWWGRTETGQALYMDYDLRRIAKAYYGGGEE
jgi:predicted  nucleic acid-binding Zn-ribbon protein